MWIYGIPDIRFEGSNPVLTGTTELALRALIFLGLSQSEKPIPPRVLAQSLGCSSTYLGKTLGLLVKGGILRSVRGARGGVVLARSPDRVTLLEIVEAAQGALLGDYCTGIKPGNLALSCQFHRVMAELHEQMIRTLSNCTLAELVACPVPQVRGNRAQALRCKMAFTGVAELASTARSLAKER